MVRIFEYLEIVEDKKGKVYRCLKCGHILGSAKENYKNFAKEKTFPIWKNEPEYVAHFAKESDTFALREYYCPKCAVMFEVDMIQKGEPHIHSVELKL